MKEQERIDAFLDEYEAIVRKHKVMINHGAFSIYPCCVISYSVPFMGSAEDVTNEAIEKTINNNLASLIEYR